MKHLSNAINKLNLALLIFIYCSYTKHVNCQAERSLMGLISAREIAELTQLATDLAAQTMQNNGKLLSKPGQPEVRPITLNQSPSEMLGQSLTNIWQPATQQLAKALTKSNQPLNLQTTDDKNSLNNELISTNSRKTFESQQPSRLMNLLFNFGKNKNFESTSSNVKQSKTLLREENDLNSQAQAMNSIMDIANTFLSGGKSDNRLRSNYETEFNRDNDNGVNRLFSMGGGMKDKNGNYQIPTLKNFLPMADRNFGFQQGEGCVPFLGEFMKIAYGNCVKQADQRTWDTWGKEIENALMGGKIDLLKASKETCKKGVEREQCGQIRRAVSDCDILGSIQLVSNMQRSISRCDEISGLIDQNPMTVLNQMNGLITGEMAQGFLNNFLG